LKSVRSRVTEKRVEMLLGTPTETVFRESIYFFLLTTSFTSALSENKRKLEIGRNKRDA